MIYKKMFEIKVKDNSVSSSGLETDIPLADLVIINKIKSFIFK